MVNKEMGKGGRGTEEMEKGEYRVNEQLKQKGGA